jgi:hypothetical protein
MNYTWSVLTGMYGSDPYSIMVAKPVTATVDGCTRWRLTGADKDSFRDLCCSELRLAAVGGWNNALNQFTSTLIFIAERTILKSCGKLKLRKKTWYNEQCKFAIRN